MTQLLLACNNPDNGNHQGPVASASEHERPGKVIVAILTDGMENASKDYSLSRVSEMARHQTEKYNWSFLFLGANIDVMAGRENLNIPVTNAVQFTANAAGYQGADTAMSRTVSRLRSAHNH